MADSTQTTPGISPLAGLPAPASMLVDVPKLLLAYYDIPDSAISEQRVIFGTSGHRGSSFDKSFNEWHIAAISQAICLYREQHHIDGPLFIGIDTHALSKPAWMTALEVFAANGVDVMISQDNEYTPTPAVSHAILKYNHQRTTGLADGIVITPSHNPPRDGGFKYNPPNGGPADLQITRWIEAKANEFLSNGLRDVKKIPFERAQRAPTVHQYDFLNTYVNDLENIIDMNVIRESGIRMGVDPLGGAGVHYWPAIAERYKINLTTLNQTVDPTFSFMSVDWDGQIRMDPSSPYAMAPLAQMKNKFDVTVACDTDHDRHGIITPNKGLLPPNHYLSVAIFYLFQHRSQWSTSAAVGKTIVSSEVIDRITAQLKRTLYEVPVGFKWFVNGLQNGSLGFGGEESAGASFCRLDGSVWTTDKDGIIMALLSAEITAKMKRDVGDIYESLEKKVGNSVFKRVDAPATPAQKEILKKLSPQQVHFTELAGEKITAILTEAPGNNEPIGGLKIVTAQGWFAARPSGTENIYRIYAESFQGEAHLERIIKEAQLIVADSLRGK